MQRTEGGFLEEHQEKKYSGSKLGKIQQRNLRGVEMKVKKKADIEERWHSRGWGSGSERRGA